jgi:hypothetical protein
MNTDTQYPDEVMDFFQFGSTYCLNSGVGTASWSSSFRGKPEEPSTLLVMWIEYSYCWDSRTFRFLPVSLSSADILANHSRKTKDW